jgi:hypothetical protein
LLTRVVVQVQRVLWCCVSAGQYKNRAERTVTYKLGFG